MAFYTDEVLRAHLSEMHSASPSIAWVSFGKWVWMGLCVVMDGIRAGHSSPFVRLGAAGGGSYGNNAGAEMFVTFSLRWLEVRRVAFLWLLYMMHVSGNYRGCDLETKTRFSCMVLWFDIVFLFFFGG